MNDCVFCKIVNKEIPSNIVYEDEKFMAFLDINPLNEGHCLVIPKKHFRWVWDVAEFGEYWEIARKVAKAQMKSLGAHLVEFLTHGIEVTHAHIWVVPIYGNEAFIDTSRRKEQTPEQLKEIADKIKEEL